ncbi:MAG: division/cell wall cluster transcriptional repressor MraZ [Bacilli bacterium]|nr:division/cell wall cluster transcriptional repressor MraZ [Bacilli bacterium]
MFIGEYHHSLDDKGRLTIPSKLRYELKEDFILTRGLDGCLFIYPKDEWENVINKYRELPNTRDARNFMRFLLSGATTCEVDKQGRINIPGPLSSYASLTKECVVIGVNERLEVWDKERWDNFMKENEDSFTDLADKLFTPNI